MKIVGSNDYNSGYYAARSKYEQGKTGAQDQLKQLQDLTGRRRGVVCPQCNNGFEMTANASITRWCNEASFALVGLIGDDLGTPLANRFVEECEIECDVWVGSSHHCGNKFKVSETREYQYLLQELSGKDTSANYLINQKNEVITGQQKLVGYFGAAVMALSYAMMLGAQASVKMRILVMGVELLLMLLALACQQSQKSDLQQSDIIQAFVSNEQ